ncbi:MAG: SEC-C domain-containing protein [Sphingomonadales bacterium]|nr:SEC-C domain-containing protein [Sphingomonadales bacterium]
MAKAGKPQVVAIIAESGLGKTRLVQEFYSWLSITEDARGGNGYWPDQLGRVRSASETRETLLLNPDIDACVMDGRNVPFLWWGIGMPNTGGDSNSVTTSLTQYETRLQLHLLAYINAVRVSELRMEHAKSAGSTAVSLGLNYADQILPHLGMAALSGLTFGMAGPAYALMGAIKDVSSAGWEARRRQQEINRLDSRDITAATAAAEKHQDIADLILGNLDLVCHAPPKPLDRLPLVLVIDDAQWIRADLSLCKLLCELLAKAGAEKWPLLALVTSWEAEWRSVNPISWDGSAKDRISEIFTAQAVNLHEHFLRPADRLEDVIAVAFPGLTEDQTALVLGKAEGNALRLYNVLSYLEGKKQYFEGRDIAAPLSVQGAQAFAAEDFDAFVMQRLQSAPEHVQAALGIASLQGMQFSAQVVAAAASKIDIANADRGLAEGENPYAFIKSAAAELAEFRAEYYQRAADNNLANLMDRDDATKALEAALVTLTGSGGDEPDPTTVAAQWQAQLALFASNDLAKRTIAFEALFRLAEKAHRDGDYLATQNFARRWAEEWLQRGPGHNTSYIQQCIIGYLAQFGQSQLALALAEECLKAIRENRDGYPESYVPMQLRWARLIAGDSAKALGKIEDALTHFNAGLQLSDELYQSGGQAEDLRYCSLFAERLSDIEAAFDPDSMLSRLEAVLEAKRKIVQQRPDFQAYEDLAIILEKLAHARHDHGEAKAVADLTNELSDVVQKIGGIASNDLQISSHAARLCNLADMFLLQSNHAEAKAILHRALEISWRTSGRLKTPQSKRTVSLVLERLAVVAEAQGDQHLALSYLLSCMDIKEALASSTDSIQALNDKVIIANKLTHLFFVNRDYKQARRFSDEATKVNAIHVEREIMSEEQFAENQEQVMAAKVELLARNDGIDLAITPWQPPPAWSESASAAIPRDTPRNASCPCGSEKRFKHCHGKS